MTLDRLQNAVSSGSAVIVAGTGVSKSLSGGAGNADWIGLLRDGLGYIERLSIADDTWVTMRRMMLDQAIEDGSTDDLIAVASAIGQKIRSQSDQCNSDWLEQSVGQLRVTSPRLGTALGSLNLPILTTNYDTLLEQSLSVGSTTWKNKDELKAVFRGESKAIGHLHGIWSDAKSVILTDADYAQLTTNDASQLIQRVFYESKSFVYVGFGSGIDDPNFTRLLNAHGSMFPESRANHFRLCKASEVTALEKRHLNSDVRVVAYGDDYADLPGFLEGLVAGIGADGRAHLKNTEYARQTVVDNIRSSYLLARQVPDYEDRELHELMVPPVLLTVPHSQTAAARTTIKESMEPIRLDANEVLQKPKILVLAGEELSGMSTALQWLLSTSSAIQGAAPVYVDARLCRSPRHPLDNVVQAAALSYRLIDHARQELPKHVLAIDNLKLGQNKIHRSIMSDINSSAAETILIGCREGDESAILRELNHARLSAEVVFLGRFGKAEIAELAEFASATQGHAIAEVVVNNLRKHNLQRTPLNICLLISLSLDGETIGATSSDTSILNQYVQKLIGWDGPYADARLTISPQNREAVLAQLARSMTEEKVGSLSYKNALSHVSDFIEAVGWPENPRETLDALIETRVLRVDDNEQVSFRQTSYLHLFSAKAAVSDVDVYYRELLERPLYYAPIIRHYAALVRGSEITLRKIKTLLEAAVIAKPASRIFGTISVTDAPPHSEQESAGEVLSEGDSEEEDDAGGSAFFYDDSSDEDLIPFPLDSEEDRPEWISRSALVDLASRVLRDSDEVRDSILKDSMFQLSIRLWGQVLDDLSTNGVFDDAAEYAVGTLHEAGYFDDSLVEEMRSVLKLVIPTFVVVAGLNTCLVSMKLVRNWERTEALPEFREDPYSSTMATIFALSLSPKGFSESLRDFSVSHGDKWIASSVLSSLAQDSYLRQSLDDDDEVGLRRFVVDMAGRRHTFKSPEDRVRWLDRFDRDLRDKRLLEQRRALGPGETFIGQLSTEASD